MSNVYVGYKGTATVGDKGTATVGDKGTATAGAKGTATAGDYGTATAGDYGTATAGDEGTATAGYNGTATAGDYGTATAGYNGTAKAGEGGTIIIRYYEANRWRVQGGHIGESRLNPDTPYKIDNAGALLKAQPELQARARLAATDRAQAWEIAWDWQGEGTGIECTGTD